VQVAGHDGRVRYPAPLQPGDLIAVTALSTGVADDVRPRLDFCVADLRERGYEVQVGACMDGSAIVSAPAAERAAELTDLLLDPAVRGVVPPWGGELAMDLLPLLDFDALAAAEPTWLVGFSDLSTVLLPLTTRLGWATVHGDKPPPPPQGYPAPSVWIGLQLEPTIHRDWIADRARAQFAGGLLEEAAKLRESYDASLRSFSAFGYHEAFAVLDGSISLEQAIERDITRTNQFARRQRTFLNHAEVSWLD
jgi:hypothetical protein